MKYIVIGMTARNAIMAMLCMKITTAQIVVVSLSGRGCSLTHDVLKYEKKIFSLKIDKVRFISYICCYI